jgi:quaternary ammonium compound-resistance protein SugE
MNAWIILGFAGIFEVAFTTCLGKSKSADGIYWYYWMAGFLISLIMSMLLLAKAIETIPIGTAYAVWTGIGAVGSVILGIVIFNEPAGAWRLFFIFTLIASIVGLKFVSHEI